MADRVDTGPLAGLPKNHYGAICADPPWAYRTYSNRAGAAPHRTVEAPYRSMPFEDLAALPVASLAAPDCLLHLWTISSHFDQALDLGRMWGFSFKSLGLNWVKTTRADPEKPKMGMGHWLRQDSEIGLIFTRGRPRRASAAVRQTILEPAREHSRKPDEALARIEALVDGPYLEMFSRSWRTGWDAMGDEVGKFTPLDEEARSLI